MATSLRGYHGRAWRRSCDEISTILEPNTFRCEAHRYGSRGTLPASQAGSIGTAAVTARPTPLVGPPLDVLFDRPGTPRYEFPVLLAARYGGSLGFRRPCLVANFVTSVDGVAALPIAAESGQVISQHSDADRFVMGLLRACSDAVMVGAGTFRKTPGHLWHPDAIYPPAAALFAETRVRLGLRPRPAFVLVTGSGDVDTTQPALQDAIFVTTPGGAARLRKRATASARFCVIDPQGGGLDGVLSELRSEGLGVLLTEGGPSLVTQLIAQNLLDELFLTVSPLLLGRHGNDGRKSLADGVDLAKTTLDLLSARRDESHLFLRYSLARSAGAAPATAL